jgi:hypothetical protein
MEKWIYIYPCIHDLCTWWKWLVRFTPRPLTRREIIPSTHWVGDNIGPRYCLNAVKERHRWNLPYHEVHWRSVGTIPVELSNVNLNIKFSGRYLHRGPASRRRRRKGKSQIWNSKIRSRDPMYLDPTKSALARASSIYKRQTRPVAREGTSQKQDRNCQIVINIWTWAPDGARHQDLLTDWPPVAMWLWLWLRLLE